MASPTFVIVGAGLAGTKAAEALRADGFADNVILIGGETYFPYDRPPLSKDFLQGKSAKQIIYIREENWYAEHDVDLRSGASVTSIDRTARVVVIEDYEQISVHKLLLATGSSPRRLSVPGADLDGVLYLRLIEDLA